MNKLGTLPTATVVSIDDRQPDVYDRPLVRVRCPFCGKVHTHGQAPDDDYIRVSHCNKGDSYRIVFDGLPVRESQRPPVCARALCGAPVGEHFDCCAACQAADGLIDAVNNAVVTFLNDRFPARPNRHCGQIDPIYDPDSPQRKTIADAGSHLMRALATLLSPVVGDQIYILGGAFPDPYDGWYGGLGWGIDKPAGTEQ